MVIQLIVLIINIWWLVMTMIDDDKLLTLVVVNIDS